MKMYHRAWVVSVSALAAVLTGCNSLPPANGPTVGVRNDSDAPLRATFWIGDRTEQRPGGRAEMSAQETLEIPPYGVKQYRLGAFSDFESPVQSFVRVQIEPVGPSFQASPQHWFELNPPSPYTIRIYGKKPQLQFERVGGGTMVAVPHELRFMNSTALTTATTPAIRFNTAPASQPPATRTVNPPRPLTGETVARPAPAQPVKVSGAGESSGFMRD